MNQKTSQYLIPAVAQLPGLIHFYAGVHRKARRYMSASGIPKSMQYGPRRGCGRVSVNPNAIVDDPYPSSHLS